MCLKLALKFTRRNDYKKPFMCSCDICGRNYTNMDTLIEHMGSHDLRDIHARIRANYGTVRCNTCYRAFDTVYNMALHSCAIDDAV